MAEPAHGFGFVTVGQSLEHRFTLKNDGTATLLIEEVTASCNCTVAKLESREIPPGGAGSLQLRYRPNSLTGPDHQTIRLRTNDPSHPEFELSINAVVVPDIRFEPPRLTLTSGAGSASTQVSTLRGTAVIRANLNLAAVRGDPAAVKQVQVTVTSGPYDAKHPPEIRAKLTAKAGKAAPLAGHVEAVVLTGLPDPTQIVVPIEWGTISPQ